MWPSAALATIEGRDLALPTHQKCLPFPPLSLIIWTYAFGSWTFAQLVWVLLPVVLILLTYPTKVSSSKER